MAPWHHSFCSSCWCNQSAWRKAELTEVLALRSTEHFKAKGWNPGHAEVSGNSATKFNEPRISPRESPLSVTFLPAASRDRAGGRGWGAELKGSTREAHPDWENRREQQKMQRFWQKKVRERRKQKHTKKTNSRTPNYLRWFLDSLSPGGSQKEV